ncbi:MAG TPA: alpha/beta hydrolase [Methylomirabilota bacterium]|nr:alpha/beta hydrolase [Methylomirabilota bacterium]
MPSLNVDGQTLHYVETGGATPTAVFLHGAGGGWGTWTRQLEGLADAGRMIALDLPGHGASSGDGCRTVADYAAVVQGFIRALGAGPVVLAGHSMGGGIAQTVALAAPSLLRGIALVGTGARLRVFPKLLELLGSSYPAAVDFVNQYAWSPASAAALKDGGRRAMLETRAPVTAGDFRACDAFDVMARLAEITVPALVIVGEDDQLTPVKYSEHLAGQIPGATLVRIRRAGHYVMLEQPDEVNLAIRRFLAVVK